MQPYMTQDRFPVDWAAAAMLKQFLGNHRRWIHRKDRLPPKPSRKGKERAQAKNRSHSGLGSHCSDESDGERGGLSVAD